MKYRVVWHTQNKFHLSKNTVSQKKTKYKIKSLYQRERRVESKAGQLYIFLKKI